MTRGEVRADHRGTEEDVCVLNLCDDGLVEDVRTDQVTAVSIKTYMRACQRYSLAANNALHTLFQTQDDVTHRTLSTLFISDTQTINYAA